MQHVVFAQAQAAVHGFRQFFISPDAGVFFSGIGCVQSRKPIGHIGIDGIEPIHHILVNLFNDLVLGCISPDPGGGFFGQSRIQVGDVFANGVGRFHNGPILYGRISLAYIIIRCLFFQILLHIGDPGIQRRIGRLTSSRFRIQVILQFIRGSVDCIGFVRNPFIQFIVFSFTSRSFVINIGLQLFIRIFQIGNRIFALPCFFLNGISIGFGLRIEGNDIFAYRIAGRYIIPAGKGIIHDALHADDFIFSGNIGLGNDFVTVDGRLGSQGTFDQSIAIHVQVATAVQAARIDGTAYVSIMAHFKGVGNLS